MKKTLITIAILLSTLSAMYGQYTTAYPFDSSWVSTFNGPVFNIITLGAIPNDTINDSQYFRMAADSIQH